MNNTLQFFDYEQCFRHYVDLISHIRQAKIQGEVIVAKPVFLLTIIDAVDGDIVTDNNFRLNDWIEERYTNLMKLHTRDSQFDVPAGIDKPFWHLESDGFWHLSYPGSLQPKAATPSKHWLKENVRYASLDEELWILLQNKTWRTKLRDFIVEQKLG